MDELTTKETMGLIIPVLLTVLALNIPSIIVAIIMHKKRCQWWVTLITYLVILAVVTGIFFWGFSVFLDSMG